MNNRQLQQMITRIVAGVELVPEKYYHLCWWREQVQCHPVRHAKEPHEVFFSALGHGFLDGLSVYQWRLVTTRMTDFCRKQGIILDRETGRRKIVRASRMPRRRITEFDAARLHGLLAGAKTPALGPHAHLDELDRLLRSADIVRPQDMPDDVVTMNSEVQLRNDEVDIEATLALVFPADARSSDLGKPKLSVFTHTGLSILGRRIGETVDGSLRILGLPYQPEAAGDFYL